MVGNGLPSNLPICYNTLIRNRHPMLNGTIATAFTDLTSFQLEEWLWEGNPTAKERRAILQELETRDKRRQAIGDLFW